MTHPLQQQIRSCASRIQRLVLGTALARVFAWTVLAALVVGLADYLLRFQDPGVRFICSLVVLATALWTGARHIFPAWRNRLSETTVAQHVERLYPELEGGVASAIEFLGQEEEDPLVGSAALRRSVIASTTAAAQQRDFSKVVNPRPFRRVLGTASVLALLIALLVVVDARAVWTATIRLSQPFGHRDWPRKNDLQWGAWPDRIARGAPFDIQLLDRNGRPPAEVTIQFRYADAEGETTEVETRRFSETAEGPRVLVRKESVRRSFAFRATGGDDDTMPWRHVEVVDPPRVDSPVITLYPPLYSGLAPYRSGPNIRALAGTHVGIQARSNKPLRAASLVTNSGREIPAALSEQGTEFAISKEQMTIESSGDYWFRLEDREGIGSLGAERWNILSIPDAKPNVAIEYPHSDIHVTNQAKLPLRVVTKDDLAIRRVDLVIRSEERRGREKEQRITLWDGPPQARPQNAASSTAPGECLDRRTDFHLWDLRLLALEPGDEIQLTAVASDYLSQETQSTPRRIIIITPTSFQARIAKRQEAILARLAQILQWQREAQTLTRDVQTELPQSGKPQRTSLDKLQSAEIHQRQIDEAFEDADEGVAAQIESILFDLSVNQARNTQAEEALQQLLSQTSKLGAGLLPVVRTDLATVLKSLRALSTAAESASAESKTALADTAQRLESIAAGQDQVISTLKQLLGEFEGWADRRQLLLELAHIQEQQQQLFRATTDLAVDKLSGLAEGINSQSNARRAALSLRQREVARRYDAFEFLMQSLGRRMQEDPLSTESAVHRALDKSSQLGIAARMREASRLIDRNQSGVASDLQKQASVDLQMVLDTLTGRQQDTDLELVKRLKAAEQQLLRLRQQQQGLQEKLALSASSSPQQDSPEEIGGQRQSLQRLRRRQKDLQHQLQNFADQLRMLKADRSARQVAKAADDTGESHDALDRQNTQASLHHAEDAGRRLADAQRRLAETTRKAESELAQLASVKLEDEVRGLLGRQRAVIEDTRRLDGLRNAEGRFSVAQQTSVRETAYQQKVLGQDAAQLTDTLPVAPVFQLALREYGSDALRASGLLGKFETGLPAQNVQSEAAERLRLLVTALSEKNQSTLDIEQDGAPSGGSTGAGGGPPKTPSYGLAELKLLAALQSEINRRTRALEDEAVKSSIHDTDFASQRERLRQEQVRLAEITAQLATPREAPSVPGPDDLPDLHELLEQEDDLPPLELDPLPAEDN